MASLPISDTARRRCEARSTLLPRRFYATTRTGVSDCVEMYQNRQFGNVAFFWHQICLFITDSVDPVLHRVAPQLTVVTSTIARSDVAVPVKDARAASVVPSAVAAHETPTVLGPSSNGR